MPSSRVRDMPASGALVGTEKLYADNGTIDVHVTPTQIADFVLPDTAGFGSLGPAGAALRVDDAATGVEWKWSTAEYIDIRDYDETLTSGSDITAAITAVAADYSNHLCRTIRVPMVGSGTFTWDPGSTTFGGTIAWVVEFACLVVQLTSTFNVRFGMTVRGVTQNNQANFLSIPNPLPLFTGSALASNASCIAFSGGQALVENITVAASNGPAMSMFGTNLITVRNCRFNTAKLTDHALDINECFWVTLENIFAQNGSGTAIPAIMFSNGTTDAGTSGGGTDCGLIKCTELRTGGSGIGFQASTGPVGTRNIFIDHYLAENLHEGNPLLSFDTSSGGGIVGMVWVRNVEMSDADVPDSNFVVYNTGARTRDVTIEVPWSNDSMIDPAGDPIEYLTFDSTLGYASGASDIGPDPIPTIHAGTKYWNKWQRKWPNAIDVRLLTAPTGIPWIPGSPLAVRSDPAQWTAQSGATITAVDGPFGDPGVAGQVVGGNGAEAYRGSHTLAVGDWLIGSVWGFRHGGGTGKLANAEVKFGITGADYNGASQEEGWFDYVEDQIEGEGWRHVAFAAKVTSIGTQPSTVQILLSEDNDSTWYNPCAVLIPTGSINDGHAMQIARSLKNGWSGYGKTGDVAFPETQDVQVRGNYVATQGKQSLWIPASRMTSRTTAGAGATTREINGITLPVLAFDTASDEGANFTVDFPDSWNRGAIKFQPVWTAASSSGTVEFEVRGACFADDAAINITGFGVAVANSDTLLAVNDVHYMSESSELTLASPDENTLGIFEIIRDVSDDTLAADAELIGLNVFYSTNSGNDAAVTHDGRVIQFHGYVTDNTNSATPTTGFSNLYIGAAATGRLVVVVAHGTAATLTSATIGGNAATIVAQATNSSCTAAMFQLVVDAGTTATVAPTWAASSNRTTLAVYSIYGLTSSTATDTDTTFADSAATKRLELNIPAGGMVVAAGGSNNSSDSFAWTGATETYDIIAESAANYSGAYLGPTKEHYSFNIKTVTTATNDTCAIAAVWA